jgi:hypothetical protein
MNVFYTNMTDRNVGYNISRRSFLKMLGSGAFVLGIGGLGNLGELFNKRSSAQGAPLQPSIAQQSTQQYPFTYIIYTKNLPNPHTGNIEAHYYAQKFDGTLLPMSGSTIPDPVIQTALDQTTQDNTAPGHIYIQDGTYNLSSSFQGFNVKSNTRLTLGPTAYLNVPNSFNGYVFKLESLNDDVCNSIIDGGYIRETIPDGGSAKRLWTGILLHASADVPRMKGVLFNKFMNTMIYDANIGIKLLVDGQQGFVNANSFQFLKMCQNNIFIDFDMRQDLEDKYGRGDETFGIHRNHFENLECQSGTNTICGVQNIRHVGNTFIDVKVWDIQKGATSNIHHHATNTIIIAGLMTNQCFTDSGAYTKIFDMYQGCKIGNDINLETPSSKPCSQPPPTTQIGMSTSEKIGFFGKSPVTQQPGASPGESAGAAYGSKEQQMLQKVYNGLKAYGLLS